MGPIDSIRPLTLAIHPLREILRYANAASPEILDGHEGRDVLSMALQDDARAAVCDGVNQLGELFARVGCRNAREARRRHGVGMKR